MTRTFTELVEYSDRLFKPGDTCRQPANWQRDVPPELHAGLKHSCSRYQAVVCHAGGRWRAVPREALK